MQPPGQSVVLHFAYALLIDSRIRMLVMTGALMAPGCTHSLGDCVVRCSNSKQACNRFVCLKMR